MTFKETHELLQTHFVLKDSLNKSKCLGSELGYGRRKGIWEMCGVNYS